MTKGRGYPPPPEINPILPRVVTISELGSIERGSCNPFYESWVDFRSVPASYYPLSEGIFHRCLVGYFSGVYFMVITYFCGVYELEHFVCYFSRVSFIAVYLVNTKRWM